jgi:hypothetical protein
MLRSERSGYESRLPARIMVSKSNSRPLAGRTPRTTFRIATAFSSVQWSKCDSPTYRQIKTRRSSPRSRSLPCLMAVRTLTLRQISRRSGIFARILPSASPISRQVKRAPLPPCPNESRSDWMNSLGLRLTIQLKRCSGHRSLTNFDQVSVRIACVAALFPWMNFWLGDELRSARAPKFIAALDVNDT